MSSWLIPLTGSILAAGAFVLHADAAQTKAPAKWWAKPAHELAVKSQPQPGGGGQVDGIVLPILDGQWFKLKVSCKGQTVDSFSGVTMSRTLKFTAYMQLQANIMLGIEGPGDGGPGFPTYTYFMWVEDGEGGWVFSYNDTLFTTGLDDNGQSTLAVNSFVGFILPTALVASQQSAQFTIKLGKEGELKSAKIKTIGSDIEDSLLAPPGLTLGGGLEYFGTMSISGSTVAVESLPFIPV